MIVPRPIALCRTANMPRAASPCSSSSWSVVLCRRGSAPWAFSFSCHDGVLLLGMPVSVVRLRRRRFPASPCPDSFSPGRHVLRVFLGHCKWRRFLFLDCCVSCSFLFLLFAPVPFRRGFVVYIGSLFTSIFEVWFGFWIVFGLVVTSCASIVLFSLSDGSLSLGSSSPSRTSFQAGMVVLFSPLVSVGRFFFLFSVVGFLFVFVFVAPLYG